MFIIIIFLFITLLISLSAFLASNSLVFALVIFAIFLLFFLIYVYRKYTYTKTRISRFNECYEYISNFIITLSVYKNITTTYEYTLIKESDDFKSLKEKTKDLEILARLEYYKKFYSFDIYSLFVNVITFYSEQGGDVLNLSSSLLNENRLQEEYVIKVSKMIKNKIIEVTLLWFITLAILVILRFSLTQFYNKLSENIYLYIGLGVFYLFLLVSLFLLVHRCSKFDIRGWNEHE